MTNEYQINTTKETFEKMDGDIVTVEWLYEIILGLHGCSDCFNDVMDPRKLIKFLTYQLQLLLKTFQNQKKKL